MYLTISTLYIPFFRFTQVSLEISHTLMIENIPKMFCRTNDELLRHFAEAFPNTEVMDLRFAYDVNKLQTVHESLKMASSSYHSCLKNKASVPYNKFIYSLFTSQFEYV